jgi:DUF1365 family protein
MSEQYKHWHEVSDRLDALALKVKLHMAQAKDDDGLPDTFNRLRDGVQDVFQAAGNAVQDEAVRTDVRELGRLLTDAFAETLERTGAEVRRLSEPHER